PRAAAEPPLPAVRLSRGSTSITETPLSSTTSPHRPSVNQADRSPANDCASRYCVFKPTSVTTTTEASPAIGRASRKIIERSGCCGGRRGGPAADAEPAATPGPAPAGG